ncbi:MAG: YfhO family protein [Bacteroidales bacterium]|nr:YfhO family protein [Bacteroidales bacterium]
MKSIVKNIAIGLGAIVLFLALSYGFVPQVLDGKIVNQSDISGYVGMSHEMTEWNKAHPDNPTYWTDSMFGGMPTTAISTQNKGDYTQWIYDVLLTGKRPATYLFITLLGAFLLFLALGVNWTVAMGGAVAVAFCSYNFQIIQVGHNTKMQAIAFMPWVLAALVYTYRAAKGQAKPFNWPSVLLGAALFGLALSMQIKANHQQITYYLALVVLLYALVELIHTIRTKAWKPFLTASLLLLVLGSAGIATNVNKLLPLAEYTPQTMRGGSELSQDGANAKGLDLDYATSWSYGWEELPNLMIPNFNGGASAGAVNPEKSATIKLLRQAGQKNLRETAKQLPMYWGPQPFTAGPMYMGAITLFLFVLGLGLYRGREKWWLAAATVLAVLMAVGNHFMAFTAFCFKVLPLYNKFRTVSMALVVLQMTLPMLGFMTLDRIVRGEYDKKRFMKAFWWAFGITGGFSLLCWLMPGLFGNFESAADAGMQDVLVEALVQDRIALFRADALLSFALIAASALLLLWAYLPKGQTEHAKEFAGFGRKWVAAVVICILSAANLFVTGKRYLNADHFTTPKDFGKPFAERPVDQIIKADKDPQYRVLDLTVNVFNSSTASFHHKTVGGYSPAKLQRYQDLIEHYLTGEINGLYKQLNEVGQLEEVEAWMASNTPVLNALNTRYVVLDGSYPPLVNDAALGTAWFVDSVAVAANPDEEIALLGAVDLRHQAVVTTPVTLSEAKSLSGSEDHIEMTSYAPNELHYRYSASGDRLAVFSEIYYPNGWHASVDGQPLDLFRADWTLRAALLPSGEHEVVMTFLPDSYRIGATFSRIASIGLLLVLLLALILPFISPSRCVPPRS